MANDERKDESIDDLFADADIVSSYTSSQAVEDGILFDVLELAKVSPGIKWAEGPFRYVTSNLCFSKGYLREGEQPNVPCLLDLFRTMAEHMRATGPDEFYSKTIEFPDGTTGDVYAGINEHGRYTLMLPDDW